MKRSILLISILVIVSSIQAQFSYLNDVKLEGESDVQEYSETVLDCCDYLLLTPYDKKDVERQAASDFIVRWTQVHPNYEFELTEDVKLITEENEVLLSLYTTCCAKHFLESENASILQELQSEAFDTFLSYCSNPMNKMKLTKEIKKRIAEQS